MNRYIVMANSIDELTKHADIIFASGMLKGLFICDSELSLEEMNNINGVLSAENDCIGRIDV